MLMKLTPSWKRKTKKSVVMVPHSNETLGNWNRFQTKIAELGEKKCNKNFFIFLIFFCLKKSTQFLELWYTDSMSIVM